MYVIAMLDLTGHMIIWGGLFVHGDGSIGLMKVLHQSFNDGMVNLEVVCHPSMAKITVMHANSLPSFWYG
jgi:hypothetical protein